MPRRARVVFPDLPHHIVQRGNRRAAVFFSDDDRRLYLEWLRDYGDAHGVKILAYCLMPNHVHLVAVPSDPGSLHRAFKPLHARYAYRMNIRHDWTGHLWQGRYFSSTLDRGYFWTALRYVECNPVRAGMVARAEDYPWSSAAAHCGLRPDITLTTDAAWKEELDQIPDWAAWLCGEDSQDRIDALRHHASNGWPCGSPEFVKDLSQRAGTPLGPRPRGRPRKAPGDPDDDADAEKE